VRIKPFNAIRPKPELAAQVASLPYDVVNAREAAAAAKGNPNSFFHISRAEIDLPSGTEPYSDAVYAKSAENFRDFKARGVFLREETPSLYVYRLKRGDHVQAGVMTVCHTGDYEKNLIRKHEKTRRAPEDDRTRHISSLNANSGPVFLTYRADSQIDAMIREVQKSAPLYDFTAPDGIVHTVWRVMDPEPLVAAFADIPQFYIADGHHRAAAAARVARERAAANPKHTGEEAYNWFLTLVFPADQLQILPYHRCVRDLNGRTKDAFLKEVAACFEVSADAASEPARAGEISMHLDGRWYRLGWEPVVSGTVAERLDVSVLQNRLLEPVLGIDDPRSNPRIEFVGGVRGTGELERKVKEGEAVVAFSMYPTSVESLMAIADAGEVMPPKSTWFEPKPRSGLLLHELGGSG